MTDVDGVVMRPMRFEDVPAVRDLLAAAEAVDDLGEHYSEDDLREELTDPLTDPATDWCVAWEGEQAVGQWRLFVRPVAEGVQKIWADGTVRPSARGRGLGSRLVPAMVARATAYAAEHSPGARLVLASGGRADNDAQAELFAASGLVPDRWEFGMGMPLDPAPEAMPLPPGYRFAPWTPDVDEELLRAHNAAFVDLPGFVAWGRADWEHRISKASSFRPDQTVLVRGGDDGIAAYVQMAEWDAVREATGLREAHVARVGTLRAHRRRGLASAALREALRRAVDAGFDRASLEVDSASPTGANGVYERIGFRVERRMASYRGEVPAGSSPVT